MASKKEQKIKEQEKEMKKRASENDDLYREQPKYPKQELRVVLPLAPSVNHMYKYIRGRKFLTKNALQYIDTVQNIVTAAKKEQGYKLEGQGVWIVVEIRYFFPDRKMRDASNMLKSLLDALQGEAFVNDRWVRVVESFVGYDKDNPRLEVKIKASDYEKDMQIVKEYNLG